MSFLLAVANTVAATPLPSPTVIKEVLQPVVNQVPVVSPNVLQLAQLLSLAAAGAITSILHLAVERGKLSGNVNRLLFTLYSAGAGVAVMALNNELRLDSASLLTGATAFVAFLGSTQGQKMITDFVASLVNRTKVDESGAVVPLVAEEPEAAV